MHHQITKKGAPPEQNRQNFKMTNATFTAAITAAKAQNLNVTDVTKGMNGYPVPFIGKFVDGFSDYGEAVKFALEHSAEIQMAHSRNGWSVVELNGYVTEAFYANEMKRDESDEIAGCDEELKDILYAHYEVLCGNDEIPSLDLDNVKNNADAEYQRLKTTDWSKTNLVFTNGDHTLTIPARCMSYNYDTHNYSIGVFVTATFDSED